MMAKELRIDVARRVTMAWGVALSLWFPFTGLAGLLIVFSIPLVLAAGMASLFLGHKIADRPILWSMLAVVAAYCLSALAVGAVAVVSLAISIPAALLFLLSVQLWPFTPDEL